MVVVVVDVVVEDGGSVGATLAEVDGIDDVAEGEDVGGIVVVVSTVNTSGEET